MRLNKFYALSITAIKNEDPFLVVW